jgi:hypothetical protein
MLSISLRRIEPKRLQFVRNLPWFAQAESIPRPWRLFGLCLVTPITLGSVGVHLIPLADTPTGETDDSSRDLMQWIINYTSTLVGSLAALHWGMQSVHFGQLVHTVEYTPLYRFMRFGLPVVPLTVSILASRLAIDDPRAACITLGCSLALMSGMDFFSYGFATSPVWFPRWNRNLIFTIFGSLFILMTSERMKIKGNLKLIQEH